LLTRLANIYLIIIWLISGIDSGVKLFTVLDIKLDHLSLIGNICIICLGLGVVYSNMQMLLEKNKVKIANLQFNKWLNFAQIFHLSILGLSYYFIVGVYITVYYYYDQIQTFGYSLSFYKLDLVMMYYKSNVIFAGLNLMPVVLFLILDKAQRDIRIENSLMDTRL